jgi:hypothetical protein
VRNQVLHLRAHNASPDTPLYSYYHRGASHLVTARAVTAALRSSCKAIGRSLGISPRDISARALRNGGCVSMIRANIDPMEARLMGRWRSWSMIEYLQSRSLDTRRYAQRMFDSGTYIIPNHQTLPTDVLLRAQKYLPPADSAA